MSRLALLGRSAPTVPAAVEPGTAVITARGVSVQFGGRTILDRIDLEVRAGQLLAVVGPNGAGKSTLLAALSGDLVPDAGEVQVGDRPYRSWSADELAMQRGVLLQQTEVSFPFTVTQIVRMGRAPWSSTAAQDWDEAVVADVLVETDTDRFAQRTYTSLSGGERARAALARVLAQEPLALLLDEPTAALDIRHQELMLALARDHAASGVAVVVVMHDLGLAAAYADEVAVVHHGALRAVGPPRRVFTGPLLSEVYDHPIEVLSHPDGSGELLVVPRRHRRASPTSEPLQATDPRGPSVALDVEGDHQ